MLKTLMSRIGVPPIAVYYLLMDEEDRKKVDFDVDALEMTAWYVSDGCRGDFQREAESNRVRRAWYVNKGVPPRPLVMPADPVEVKMIEEGEKRAQARLEMPTPDIWISFSTGGLEDRLEEFGDAVKGYVSKVESGKYEKFLSG